MSRVYTSGDESGSPLLRGIVLGLLGLGLLAGGGFLISEVWSALRGQSWPKAEAKVEASQVLQEVRTRGGPQFRIKLNYRYTVDGKAYTGERFNNRNNYLSGEGQARSVAQAYPQGARCEVFYNPNDPAEAVIDPSVTWHTWGRLALGAVGLLLGVWLAYLGLKEFLPKRRTSPGEQHLRPA